jgi:diaminohydroxyphosphoribosylaminopyrimidine deaminase/5-amino-6-(5-phosphoribosylamino)uracil reductase
MERAIALSREGLGRTFPNPTVGCVVLDESGEFVGEGTTAPPGGPHAEVVALSAAGERAQGGTAVVTLEPCSHVGRTGPCVEALVEAGIARVVYAVADPHPAAAGGADALRGQGIDVEGGLLADGAAEVNRPWLVAIERGRPFVTLKLAVSLDGRVAAVDGSSRWITGPAARLDAHVLRAECDAILVGTGTAVTDDPALTVRDETGIAVDHQPLRVIMGHRALPAQARLLDDSAETLQIPTHDVTEVMEVLQLREIRSLLVEGGPTIAGAMLRAGVVDRVVAYVAPVILGAGPAAIDGAAVGTIHEALRLTEVNVRTVGNDVRIEGRPFDPTDQQKAGG